VMRLAEFDSVQRYYWGFLGDVVMMNMLKSIIVPLITFSIITGVASLAESGGKLSLYAVIYYLSTTVIAIILGIVMSVLIKPGKGVPDEFKTDDAFENANVKPKGVADGLLDIIRNCFPRNVVEATFNQASTYRLENPSTNVTSIVVEYGGSQNVLGLIVFCSTLGFFLGKLSFKGNKSARQVLSLISGLNDAIMEMVDLIMWYVPIGLLFLISKKIMDMPEDMGSIWAALGMFAVTSIASLFIHGLIILPLIYFLVTRQNPLTFFLGVLQAIVTAFANASSAATLPITLRNLEVNNKIDQRVTRFMLPLGATINMDGTALYEAIAALFIAQLEGIELGFGQIITVAITSTAASIGAAAVPSAGLITLIIVLQAVGLPTNNISLILTIDWFIDRIRTMVNVWGDAVGCGIVQHLNKEYLESTRAEYISGDTDDKKNDKSHDNLTFSSA